jgi:hypothetical protein
MRQWSSPAQPPMLHDKICGLLKKTAGRQAQRLPRIERQIRSACQFETSGYLPHVVIAE